MKNQELKRQLEEIQTLLKQKDEIGHKQSIKPLNFVEAAQYLSLSHSTLYKLTYQRKIPCHKPNGKYLYFFKHELDEWIGKSNCELRIRPKDGGQVENGELKEEDEKEETEADETGTRKEAG